MLIIGLTGSIAMGKSTIAKLLNDQGIKTISADAIVHDLYSSSAVDLIEQNFPDSTIIQDGSRIVDRQKLLKIVLDQKDGFKKLESLIHPLVRQQQWQFIKQQKIMNARMVIIEIPLLFETGAEKNFDAVLLASANEDVQRERVFQRPDMTEEKFKALLAKQMPDHQKREKADFIINTACSLDETRAELISALKALKTYPKNAYQKWQSNMDPTPDN